MLIGYARSSTLDQKASIDAQVRDLQAAGCDKIHQEQVSSVDVVRRIQLVEALEHIRKGDTLVVTKLDRLARSVRHLFEITETLAEKGAGLRILDLGIDTSKPTGKLVLTVLGGIAEFEREIMLERQREGESRGEVQGPEANRKGEIRGGGSIEGPGRRADRDCQAVGDRTGVGVPDSCEFGVIGWQCPERGMC